MFIHQLIPKLTDGQIRVPAFQRGFVWEPDQVAFFMDSIYRGYPFGTLLFWRTRKPLKSERTLGPFPLPARDPEYPVDYVLDGQQRLTSVFGVFQTEIPPTSEELWTHIYFDYRASPDTQEPLFSALPHDQVDPSRHFPLDCLFDTVAYRRATKQLSDKDAIRIDHLQERFRQADIPIQTFETENRAAVATIFERVNHTGVRLDTFQLLCAWTWSEDFALREQFEELSAELAPFGFEELGADMNLLLRCCAALLAGSVSPEALVELPGARVRDRLSEVRNGVRGAIDFLKMHLHVHSLGALPFSIMLVPLAVFFAVPPGADHQMSAGQSSQILRWFWRSCFARRFSSGVLRALQTDIEEIVKLKNGHPSALGEFPVTAEPEFFTKNTFRVGTVNTKTFVLLLAQASPRSFVSGNPILLHEVLRAYNRSEFHHLFPRAFLQTLSESMETNQLANICLLSRGDNNALGARAPSQYVEDMPADVGPILKAALCPDSLFSGNYSTFLKDRAAILARKAQTLMA